MAFAKSLTAVRGGKSERVELEYLITGDGDAGSVTVFHRELRMKYLMDIITVPVSNGSTYTLTVTDVNSVQVCDPLTSRSTTLTQREHVPYNASKNVVINGPLTLTFTDFGDSGQQVTVKLIAVA